MRRYIFGAAVALTLLVIYGYSVVFAVSIVLCTTSSPPCETRTISDFNETLAFSLTTIGGLVSALVIAELAMKKPGKLVRTASEAGGQDPNTQKTINILTNLYIIAWFIIGLLAFVVGGLSHPNVLQSLTDLGKSWLGLAVASAYAYFGVDPQA